MKHSLACALALVLGVFLTALLVGCGGGDEGGPRQFGSLQFNLTSDKTTYARDEVVKLTFTVKNVGAQPVNAVEANCITRFKVTQGSRTIGPEPGGCGGGARTVTIAPGET